MLKMEPRGSALHFLGSLLLTFYLTSWKVYQRLNGRLLLKTVPDGVSRVPEV